MAKVKAIAVGYYKHRRVKVGEIFNMKEVDEEGFYVDKSGKRKIFTVQDKDKDGKVIRELSKGERKCRWVSHVNSDLDAPLDPKQVAAVISGKNPGQQVESDEDDAESAPAKGK